MAGYLRQVGLGISRLLNAMTGGDASETLSTRAGKARKTGRKWGCVLCGVLEWFHKGHCEQ
jgi:hypothetical protein